MKTFVRLAVALLAITVVCQASLALAEDYYWASGSGQPASLTGQEKAAGQGQSACNSCNQASCCPEQSCGECGTWRAAAATWAATNARPTASSALPDSIRSRASATWTARAISAS